MSLPRRDFLAGSAAWAAGKPPSFAAAIKAHMAALPPGPVLLHSYLVRQGKGANAFDLTQANAAYVYDNALAGLLLLAAGARSDALRIGQALAIAQAHDRFFHDGRLRNAYQAGAMATPAKLPGFWNSKTQQWDEDPYQLGTDSGPVAWAMLLWAALGLKEPAKRAGDFLNAQLRAPSGYYGGFYGFDAHQSKLLWQSTEQNTDLSAAFHAVGRKADAQHAAAFVRGMFNAKSGLFATGMGPGGQVNRTLCADAGIWPYLAGLGDAKSAFKAILALQHGAGIGFSAASQGIWLEGTSFAMLALKRMSNDLAAGFWTTVRRNIAPSGYVYATVAAEMSTGLRVGPALKPGQPELAFNYYRRPSLSATSWAGLAAMGVNPLG